jgi:hypothetical protein
VLYIYVPLIVARQRLGILYLSFRCPARRSRRNGELLEASCSMRFVSYEGKTGDYFFPKLLVLLLLPITILVLSFDFLLKKLKKTAIIFFKFSMQSSLHTLLLSRGCCYCLHLFLRYLCNSCMYVCMYVEGVGQKSGPCTATINDLLCFPY